MILQLDGRLNSLLDNWPVWRKRIIKYAKLEGRNRDSVKRLLGPREKELGNNWWEISIKKLLKEKGIINSVKALL